MPDKAEKDLNNGVHVVINGIINVLREPESGFGKQIIYWENGRPTRYETTSSNKLIK